MCQQPSVHAFTYDCNFSSLHALWVSQWALTVFTLVALLGHFQPATAADLSLEWDPVADDRVAVYKVHWGTASDEYQSSQEAVSTTTTLTGLQEGATYYFAACACDENGRALQRILRGDIHHYCLRKSTSRFQRKHVVWRCASLGRLDKRVDRHG